MFLTLVAFCAKAQQDSKQGGRSFILGAGNYEYLYAGMQFPVKSRSYLEIAGGLKPSGIRTQKYAMSYIAIGASLLKENRTRMIDLNIQFKLLPWYFENSYNRFIVLGAIPELRLTGDLKRRLKLAGSIGMIYNNVLYKKEKSPITENPEKFGSSFSLQAIYMLPK